MNRVVNARLNVKPVVGWMIHSGVYEGPCRVGNEKTLSPETEKAQGSLYLNRFYEELKGNLTSDANVLEPAYMEYGEVGMPEGEFKKLEADLQDVDLFLVSGKFAPASGIVQRYKKPVAMLGQITATPSLRAMGFESYNYIDFDDLNHLISLLRVRKAIRQTKILGVTAGDRRSQTLEDLKSSYGIDYKSISSEEVFDEMDKVIQSGAEREKAGEITDRLINSAQGVQMEREHILQSVNFYLAAKNLIEKYGCNAFSMPCFELCYTRIPAERKVVFCLTHSLLKDEGYTSACEGDVIVLPAMMLLMYISKKSAPMGNTYIVNKEENIMALHHDVPGLKMKGLGEPDLPYEIRNFTVGGWGATIRYDFSRDKGEIVTLARFNPKGTKLLVVKGEIVGGEGFDKIGCTLRADIKVPDVVGWARKQANFGHHFSMVYGDYIQELKELGELMGFEVTEA